MVYDDLTAFQHFEIVQLRNFSFKKQLTLGINCCRSDDINQHKKTSILPNFCHFLQKTKQIRIMKFDWTNTVLHKTILVISQQCLLTSCELFPYFRHSSFDRNYKDVYDKKLVSTFYAIAIIITIIIFITMFVSRKYRWKMGKHFSVC